MTTRETGLFEKMLFADTFRGPHSTGVFCRRTLSMGGKVHTSIPMFKKAVEGPAFLETLGWQQTLCGFKEKADLPNFLVGHNRYATMGGINDENAHPFKIGEITLVHNGTLIDQALLPDHHNFLVDSENVAHSINKIGSKETIQLLDGAFTLIWHNSKTDTLHIIRNEERPFHLARSTTGDWFGASEEDMLMWILDRGKLPVNVAKHFECRVGVEYIFDVNDCFELVHEIEHKLPDFSSKWCSSLYGGFGGYGSGYGGYNNSSYLGLPESNKGKTSSETKKKPDPINNRKIVKANDVLRDAGLTEKMGERLQFTAYDFNPYVRGTNNNLGRVQGYIDHSVIYVEVQMHNVEEAWYSKHEDLVGTIVGAYEDHGVTVVLLKSHGVKTGGTVVPFPKNTSNKDPIDLVGELDDEEIIEETRESNGKFYTKAGWEKSNNSQCGNCSERIPFNEIDESVTWIECTPICSECEDIVNYVLEGVTEYPHVNVFSCQNCGEEVLNKYESNINEICRKCHSWLERENIH